MKIVVFAGGVGSRLWPLSRKNTPKQFGKIVGDQSTLQQTVARLLPEFSAEDIFIATGGKYQDIVREQLPMIPHDNFLFEPMMRDVGPAIGLVGSLLEKRFPDEPMAILWSDHLVKNEEHFRKILAMAGKSVSSQESDFVFIAQQPRFANANIGWLEIADKKSEENNAQVYEFKRLIYGPSPEDAVSFFESGNYVWNLGYFVTTPRYLTSLFAKYVPEMHEQLNIIANSWGTEQFDENLTTIYPTLEKISFDHAVLVKMSTEKVFVVSSEFGWSDVGTWDAMKEALTETKDENVTNGTVLLEDAKDVLVFNNNDKQLVVGVDLEEMVIINTHDVLLLCPKKSVPKIKKLVEKLGSSEFEHLV